MLKDNVHSLTAVMGIRPVQTIDYLSTIVWPVRLSPKLDSFCSAAFMAFSFCLTASTTRLVVILLSYPSGLHLKKFMNGVLWTLIPI